MINKCILILILSLVDFHIFGQTKGVIVKSLNFSQDVAPLKARINKLIKNDVILSKIGQFSQFHIYWVSYNDSIRKEEFLDDSFTKNLEPNYFSQRVFLRTRKFLDTETLIADSLGILVATSDGRIIHSAYKYNHPYSEDYIELTRLFNSKEIESAFYICLTSGDILFGVKGDKICVIRMMSNCIKIYSVKDFMSEYWNDFIF